MNIIEVSHLVKEYKKIKKERGLYGAVKNLFVQDVQYVRAVMIFPLRWKKGILWLTSAPTAREKVPR